MNAMKTTQLFVSAVSLLTFSAMAQADSAVPPWTDPGDIPLPAWAKSVVPKASETPIFIAPGAVDQKRGVLATGAHVPLYAAKRGASCSGRWLEIGPLAWVCSDAADLSADPPDFAKRVVNADGLPYRYFFVGRDGAWAFNRPETAEDDQPDQELEAGWGIAIVEEKNVNGAAWGLTNHGHWIEMRSLVPARPSAFHGEEIHDGKMDFAWIVAERSTPRLITKDLKNKVNGGLATTHVRWEVVPWREERVIGTAPMTRISEDGAEPETWLPSKDLAHPLRMSPPDDAQPGERWIDVDLKSQTLVAYEGETPLFSTLLSTGIGAQGTDTATPRGMHRLWVKLASTDMGNLDRDDADQHYSIEDVPFVQFFDHAVGLHGAFWHHDFGRVRSHGCVNLAPLDAARLFDFTSPHLPRGWTAVFPTPLEKGTIVRVR
jgi:lipoprotein-anchoring transpeptidase ErfK/SrfK